MDTRIFYKWKISWCRHCRDNILIALQHSTVIPRFIQSKYLLKFDEDCNCDILGIHIAHRDGPTEPMDGWLCNKSNTLKLTNTSRRGILRYCG